MRRGLLMLALVSFVILDLHIFLWNGSAAGNAHPIEIVPLIDVHARPEVAVEDETASFGEGISAALNEKRYADLETLAAGLRDPDQRFRGGTSKITRFYAILTHVEKLPTDDPCGCSHFKPEAFAAKRAQLEAWRAAMPDQMTADVALAKLWDAAAWAARGGDFASKVTADQWAEMNEDFGHARYYLTAAKSDRDPVIYEVMLSIALAGSDRRTLADLYDKAIESYPTYYNYYGDRARSLLEKWYGRPGELAHYLESLIAPERGTEGRIAYAFAAYRLLGEYKQPDEPDFLPFPAIVAAYQAREQRFGLRPHDWAALFYFSLYGRMSVSAIQAFQRMGTDWDSTVWSSHERFDQDVAWYKANIESLAWAKHLMAK